MRRILISILISTMLISVTSCSPVENRALEIEKMQLEQVIKDLEIERNAYKDKYEELNDFRNNGPKVPSIMYSDYEQKFRLVMSEVDLHIYFGSTAPVVNKIKPNTAVKVLDAGMVEGDGLWLYVELPVYDIPAFYKGWIREADTLELTEQNKKQAYDSVIINKGIEIFNCDDFEEIQKTKPEKTRQDMNVRILKLEKDYAYVFSAGGWTFWVKEENIKYAYDMIKQ